MKQMQARELSANEKKLVCQRITFYEGPEWRRHMEDCVENRRYFFGEQWTSTEINTRTAADKTTKTMNRLRKTINAIVGIKTANKPKYLAVSQGDEDGKISDISNKLLDWLYYRSDGSEKLRNAILCGSRDNIGYVYVHLDSTGKPIFTDLEYSDVLIDPRSKDPMFKDAEYIYIKKWIPIERASRSSPATVSESATSKRS